MSEGPDLRRLAGLRARGRGRAAPPGRRRSSSPPRSSEPGGSRASAWLLLAVQLLAAAAVAFYASRHPLVPHTFEGNTYWRYLLHTLVGLGLGLGFAAIVVGLRRGQPAGAAGWAVLGAVLSVVPDLLFTFDGYPHKPWADYFLAHLSVDTVPQPLLVGLGVFVLGGWAWWAASRRHAVVAVVLVFATAGLFAGALVAGNGPHTARAVSTAFFSLPR
jgi:FtsH-binding integral membrane protein